MERSLFPALKFLLATGAGVGGGRGACGFRYAQVTRSSALADFVDYQLNRLAGSAGVEEDRLIYRTVLLLETLVVRQHVDGELVLLGVGVPQFHLNHSDLLRA